MKVSKDELDCMRSLNYPLGVAVPVPTGPTANYLPRSHSDFQQVSEASRIATPNVSSTSV